MCVCGGFCFLLFVVVSFFVLVVVVCFVLICWFVFKTWSVER